MSAPVEPDGAAYSLETLAEAVNYNEWVYSVLALPPGARVLELGCGIGNLTPLFLRESRSVLAIDIDPRLVAYHRRTVGARPNLEVREIAIQDLVATHAGQFDAVVSSNVLEHIPDGVETEVVRAMYALLKPGGMAAHWVPATPGIYGTLDETFGHFRRYTKPRLKGLFTAAGFRIEQCSYWNCIGLAGWWWHGRIKKARAIDRKQALVFDRWFVPWLRRAERILPLPAGQSLHIHARKL